MSESGREKRWSERTTDLAKGERGLGIPLSATCPYIAWQEDPTNSDTAASAAAKAQLLSRLGKVRPKERVCGTKWQSKHKGEKGKTAGENSENARTETAGECTRR